MVAAAVRLELEHPPGRFLSAILEAARGEVDGRRRARRLLALIARQGGPADVAGAWVDPWATITLSHEVLPNSAGGRVVTREG